MALTPDNKVVVLDSSTGAVLRVLAEHSMAVPQGYNAPAELWGGLRFPRSGVGLLGYDWCQDHGISTIFRVPMAGGLPPQKVANGVGPAVSPDGRKLAYAAPPARFGGPEDPGYGCYTAVAVRDLQTGEEQAWYPKPPPDRGSGTGERGMVGAFSWSEDSRRVAFTTCYEGCGPVQILDISRRGFLYETAEQTRLGAGDIAWQSSAGLMAVVESCCYGDDPWTQPPVARVYSLDGRRVRELVPENARPTAIDYDASGSHLLYLSSQRSGELNLHVVGEDGVVRDLPGEFRAADW